MKQTEFVERFDRLEKKGDEGFARTQVHFAQLTGEGWIGRPIGICNPFQL